MGITKKQDKNVFWNVFAISKIATVKEIVLFLLHFSVHKKKKKKEPNKNKKKMKIKIE